MKYRVSQSTQRQTIALSSMLCLLLLMPLSVLGQEQSFPLPSTTGVIGKKDPGALAEIKAHLLAAEASGWQALQATGTLTYPEGDAHEAMLYLTGARHSRLDIKMGAGTRSLRVQGAAGRFQDEQGNQGFLPPGTSCAGIVAFPRIWTVAATSSHISLNNQNVYEGEGQNLHRITMEYPIESAAGERLGGRTAVTDLYFDPGTHFLIYSVDVVKFQGSMQTFSRVTAYGDYHRSAVSRCPRQSSSI